MAKLSTCPCCRQSPAASDKLDVDSFEAHCHESKKRNFRCAEIPASKLKKASEATRLAEIGGYLQLAEYYSEDIVHHCVIH